MHALRTLVSALALHDADAVSSETTPAGIESAKRQALYMTGLVVANHLVSAIHAARSAGRERGTDRLEQASLLPLRGGLMLALTRRF